MSVFYRFHPSLRKLMHPESYKVIRQPQDRIKVRELPLPYQKFYTEWIESETKETPVHWIPKPGRWERNPKTGEVKQIQNCPINVNYPYEHNEGLWGGEGVVQGTVKKGKWRTPVPRYWVPELKKSVVYSEILDQYLSVVVTLRALQLIDEHHGLDTYLMMTPAYDLKSLLALKIKRKIMTALLDKDFCHDDPQRQKELLDKFQKYLIPREDLEWYALSVDEAIEQHRQIQAAAVKPVPLKIQFRAQLLKQLKQERENSSTTSIKGSSFESIPDEKKTWISRINPFAK